MNNLGCTWSWSGNTFIDSTGEVFGVSPVLISAYLPPGPGADHISEEWGERVEDDVRETGEVGLHVSDVRLRQPRARSDPPSQREAARG